METETMGKVLVTAKVENLDDLVLARNGIRPADGMETAGMPLNPWDHRSVIEAQNQLHAHADAAVKAPSDSEPKKV